LSLLTTFFMTNSRTNIFMTMGNVIGSVDGHRRCLPSLITQIIVDKFVK